MPRSWHSWTSYLNFRETGSPQMSQMLIRLSLRWPQSGQTMLKILGFCTAIFLPHLVQAILRCWRPSSLPHLHSQFPMEYSSNSSDDVPRKSEMGKIDWNTACSPFSSRSAGAVYICRKRSYDRFCTSMRLGIGMEVRIFEKLTRSGWEVSRGVSF